MDLFRGVLEHQPLTALFLTIALGYVAGEVSVRGVSLGVGAVLFVALAVGWFAPKSAPPAVLGTFGLALFLYAVGVQYGSQFVAGLTSAAGLKANLAALVGVLVAGAVALLLVRVAGLNPGYAIGLFAGSCTSTATLQAAITAVGNDDPAVGYSVAYPFGVAGPILLLQLTVLLRKPLIEPPAPSDLELAEVALRRPEYYGKRVAEVMTTLPAEVHLAAVRRDGRNRPLTADSVLAGGDVLLVVAPTRGVLDEACAALGELAAGGLIGDRRHLDYLRVFASRSAVVGRRLGELELPGGQATAVVQVRRGDTELMSRPDLVLESGDRVGLLANRADFPALRTLFGDSIKGAAELSYVSIGLGMALGFLVGAVPIPLPGAGTFTLGVSGVLIVALVLGHRRRTAGLCWTMPVSANLVLRNLGLTVFLAQVGLASGPKFAAAVSETGLQLLALGAVVLFALVVPILLLGLFVFRIAYADLAGIVAGAGGNAAILVFANRQVSSDRPDVGYAMIFPSMTIVKIVFVSVAAAFL